jgi:hypothetical protein
MERDVRHRIVFGPTSAASVVIVIEYVEDFSIANGRDADGDGFGTATDTIKTPCTPPSGYVQNTSDCDDEDPSLNPGAVEICDGLDQNCNGVPDDARLECRVGKGVCEAVGTWVCDGMTAEPVRCSVEAGPPAAPACNGKDNDCDGVNERDHALCSDASEGPSCVREAFTAFCGCSLDLDCGGPDSGRVCDLKAHKCVDGCSAAQGRNGCPAGQSCDESKRPGTCVADVPGQGAAGSSGAPDAPADDGSDDGGCGCRAAGGGPTSSSVWLLALLAGVVVSRRTSTRSRRAADAASAAASALAVLGITAGLLAGTSACGGALEVNADDGASGRGTGLGGAAMNVSGAACVPVLGPSTVAHACSHTDNGPYIPIAALNAMKADVSTLHRAFSVSIVEAGATLVYTPKRDGEHVFLTDRVVAFDVVKQGAGQRLQGEPFPVANCKTIARSVRAQLVVDETYEIRLREPANTEFKLFIEYPPAFGSKAWESSCQP